MIMEAPVASDGVTSTGYRETVKIPDRLLRRDQDRLEEAVRRKEAKENLSVSEEKIDHFSSAFNTEKTVIEELLSVCSEADRDQLSRVLEEVTSRIQQLQKFLNDSTVFLTQYELRQAQASLQKLQCGLEEKRDEFIPKKKFAFRSRNIGANMSKVIKPIRDQPASSDSGSSDGNLGVVSVVYAEQCGFSNAHSQVLTKEADEIQQRDVLLSHLTNCKVRLLGSPSTLHIKHVRDSEILCGPVSSSVFVDQCTGCTLAVPCQQLRTHNTTDTQVYLHVTSRAIIEDCTGVGFAPFTWSYDGIDADFKLAGLDFERNNWNQVDDFNWLAAGTPSPNWTVIPALERKCTWE
ncbi:hypothetical protein SKAU_G00142390 [Synaphobranchus kaupii]|uniref:Tubulin-specific chaperone C n=1 Tax=Synaphobranchus kaupii TaxID=118154 RepID=A0A9Q1FTL5_SYNKA|nr:hypothetical protein SKAU_G00142390 [Synaphobranchus kaupii]